MRISDWSSDVCSSDLQRIEQRTQFDLEMIREIGYCNGIENYSRYLSGRNPGEPPPCLFDYLPPDALVVLDESHVTVPQIGAMYTGDRSRKETLDRKSVGSGKGVAVGGDIGGGRNKK